MALTAQSLHQSMCAHHLKDGIEASKQVDVGRWHSQPPDVLVATVVAWVFITAGTVRGRWVV
jgi:hypothetical protein